MTPETDTSATGLSADEVRARVADGRVNQVYDGPGRSLGQIVAANVLTPVNGIMLVLFGLIMLTGHWRDGLFVGVVFSNSVVGIVQEIRARRELSRLEVMNQPGATVIRDGSTREVSVEEVVADDLVVVGPGDQIVVDGEIVDAEGLEVDESLLSGEADAIAKESGERVLSGSFVVGGAGRYRATGVGAASYAAELAAEARRFSTTQSQLRQGVNRILLVLVALIPVASALLFWSLLTRGDVWRDALQGTVAAAVAMVPDGLVLLTSIAFLAGIMQLARHGALAKQLSAVEVLARVDVLCLDKTGTITTGNMSLATVEPLDRHDDEEISTILAALVAAEPHPNSTLTAIGRGVTDDPGWSPTSTEPFSSERKWSSVTFDDATYFLGAPDVLLADDHAALARAGELADTGRRVVLLARSDSPPEDGRIRSDLSAIALLVLEDTIRPESAEVIDYFRAQGVAVKIISGDNSQTVAAIASRAGIEGADDSCNARTLPEDQDELAQAVLDHTVIGRASPHHKQAIVRALQAHGHVVAMTGDGVNDVLALKEADLGVAMGSGSPATRAVADLVLTDSSFASLPVVVDEGRKVINNVERVSNLFLSKVAYAVLLTIAVPFLDMPFPFLPRQLTLIGTFSIGLPGFFLALDPEVVRVRGGFLSRVLRFSTPAGIVAGALTLLVFEIGRSSGSVSLSEARTAATVTLLGIGLGILLVVSRPLSRWKATLAAGMAALYGVIFLIGPLRDFFALDFFAAWMWPLVGAAIATGGALCAAIPRLVPGLDKSHPEAAVT